MVYKIIRKCKEISFTPKPIRLIRPIRLIYMNWFTLLAYF